MTRPPHQMHRCPTCRANTLIVVEPGDTVDAHETTPGDKVGNAYPLLSSRVRRYLVLTNEFKDYRGDLLRVADCLTGIVSFMSDARVVKIVYRDGQRL